MNEMMTEFPIPILKKIYSKDPLKYKCIREWGIHTGIYINASDKILGDIYKKYFSEDFDYKSLYTSDDIIAIEIAIKHIEEGEKILKEVKKNIFIDEYIDILLEKIKTSRETILKKLLFRLYEITND